MGTAKNYWTADLRELPLIESIFHFKSEWRIHIPRDGFLRHRRSSEHKLTMYKRLYFDLLVFIEMEGDKWIGYGISAERGKDFPMEGLPPEIFIQEINEHIREENYRRAVERAEIRRKQREAEKRRQEWKKIEEDFYNAKQGRKMLNEGLKQIGFERITKKEAARRLGVKYHTMDRWMRFRAFPHIRIPETHLIDPDGLEEFKKIIEAKTAERKARSEEIKREKAARRARVEAKAKEKGER